MPFPGKQKKLTAEIAEHAEEKYRRMEEWNIGQKIEPPKPIIPLFKYSNCLQIPASQFVCFREAFGEN